MTYYKRITLDELRDMAKKAKNCIDHIYLHWSAGLYNQPWPEYHLLIYEDGSIVATTDNLTERLNHTWHRNGAAIGIALTCCCGADAEASKTGDFGEYPPTSAQIEGMAQAVAALCEELDLEINSNNVMTHCEAALQDGYGPYSGDEETRWDLWYLPDIPGDGLIKPGGDVIRGKAIYFDKLWNKEE